jgi:hypothetical protein
MYFWSAGDVMATTGAGGGAGVTVAGKGVGVGGTGVAVGITEVAVAGNGVVVGLGVRLVANAVWVASAT